MSIALVAGVGLLLGGAWLSVIHGADIVKAIQSRSWPSVPGVLRKAELEFDPEDSSYTVAVSYVFEIDGDQVSASVVRFGDRLAFRSKLEAIKYLRGYSVGRKVQVYYCPSDPSKAVLRPGASFRAMRISLVGATLLLIGASIFAL